MNTLNEQDAATPPDESIRLIPLSQGKFAIVDTADFDWLNQWKWTVIHQTPNSPWYAYRPFLIDGKRVNVRMHRLIINAPNGVEVDHRDGDGLNNRRSNLRFATRQQNACNRKANIGNKSGAKGVFWYKRTKMWRVAIGIKRKQIHIGYFKTKAEAIEAYRKASMQFHRDFANPAINHSPL